jgi:transcriptional regulator with XRE-family HTH domain
MPNKNAPAEPKPAARPRKRGRLSSGDRHPTTIDAHVGARVRLRRTLLGYTQEYLGHQLGLTFQQIQKYERGANRIGASRLYDLSRVLDVPVSFFFDDMPEEIGRDPAGRDQAGYDVTNRINLDLLRAFSGVQNPVVKTDILAFVRSVAGLQPALTVRVGAAAPANKAGTPRIERKSRVA